MEHERNGRLWTAVRQEPYTRKDGTSTELIVWRGHCRYCGAPFEVSTPQRFESSKSFDVAHCPSHRGLKA